ncbi:MAG: hypothetical protein ACF8MJ_08225 [Phycisphaerales bacterium JB050]
MPRRLRRLSRFPLMVAAIACCAGAAFGQTDRPSAANRLVKLWDFEDRIINGFIADFPQDWYSGNPVPPQPDRQGFPFWNEPGFSTASPASGEYCMRLPTKGGSTSVKLSRSALVVMPGSDYLVTAMVRTDGLVHARARLITRYVRSTIEIDPQTGNRSTGYLPIEGTEVQTPLIISEGEWTPVQLRVDAHPEAEFLEIELLLLQPEQFLEELRPAPINEDAPAEALNPALPPDLREQRLAHEVIREDRTGSASFDLVSVYQMPRLELRSTVPSNFIVAPTKPELVLQVFDLTGEALTADLTLYDLDGSVLASERFRGSDLSAPVRWVPPINDYGWYRATLDVSNVEGLVAQAFTQFVYLAPEGPLDREEMRRFGVLAEGLSPEQLELLPEVIRAIRSGSIWINIWGDDPLGASIGAQRFGGTPSEFETAINRLLEANQDITFVLDAAPEGVARSAGLDRNALLDIFERDPSLWGTSLEPLLTRFGERVSRWQIGPTGTAAVFWDDDPWPPLGMVTTLLERLVPRPAVVLPWQATHSVPARLQGESSDGAATSEHTTNPLTISIPPDIGDGAIPELARLWPNTAGTTVVIERGDREQYGRRSIAIDLTRRAALAWFSGIERLAIPSPWQWRKPRNAAEHYDGLMPYEGQWLPEIEAPVWRTLSQALSMQEPAGEFRTIDGLRVLIGRPRAMSRSAGVLVAWNEFATEREAVLRAHLGDGSIRVSDPFGNSHDVQPVDGVHEIRLGQMPLIIEGVNADLAMLRAGLEIVPRQIPARAMRHDLELVIRNPYPSGISGRVRLMEPERWNFTPRVIRFSVRRGEEVRLPFTIELGIGEEAGPREIMAELELVADREYPIMYVPLQVELGLDAIELTVNYRFAPAADGSLSTLIVEALVTNTSPDPISLEAVTLAPGFQTQSAPISALEPGDSVVKRFLFLNAADALRGNRVRVSVREQEGSGRLNRTIEIR